MREFLKKHSYLVLWVSALIVIGAIAEIIIQVNGVFSSSVAQNQAQQLHLINRTPPPPTPPPPPSVTFTIQKGKNGNSFFVQWHNLPNGTVALDIYRGKTGTDPKTWQLWKTIALSPEDLANGSANIDIGKLTEAGYSFSVEAVGGGNNGNSTSTTPIILWESSSTIPTVTTSTPSSTNSPSDNTQNQNTTNTNTNTPTTSTSSQQTSSSSTSQNNQQSGNNPSTPTGTPYYTPQVQLSGYGSPQTGNFWAINQNGRIQIGWQDLPPQTTSIVVSRSQSQSGPWTTVLTQQNPTTSGSYSLQVLDSTVNTPYYYEMQASQGGGITVTYGPVSVIN